MATLLTHIQQLVNVSQPSAPLRGSELADLPVLDHAFLIIEGERISGIGSMDDLRFTPHDFDQTIDCSGRLVLPSWCDSHTHLVFAGSREGEFVDKIQGKTYAEIAAKGGGILNSARKLAETDEEQLYRQSAARLREVMRMGTGAIEIKSGYGLTVESELKMLRVIRRLKTEFRIPIKATFLGAHSLPEAYKGNKEGYIQLILNEMLPVIGREGLADYLDVFCEEGFFTPEDTLRIGRAGAGYGLKAKIHANQLQVSGGVQAGIALNALSVDHLESMDAAAITALAGSSTIGTLLPTAAFFLRMPFQPARQLIEAGCRVALASDYNPGSSPSGNMNFVVAISCIGMRMLPQEAINAATINGAFAMEVNQDAGSIAIGKLANLLVTKPVPSFQYLPYSFAHNNLERVMAAGEWLD